MRLSHAAIALLGVVLGGCGGSGAAGPDLNFDGTGTTMPPPDAGASIIVDHRQAFASATLIPDSSMTAGRGLQVMFGHQSVGQNILDGLTALAGHNPARYGVNIVGYPASDVNGCVSQFAVGTNGDPQGKIVDFTTKANSGSMSGVQVALFKFCFVDFTDATDVTGLLTAYTAAMTGLENAHPTVKFVYCTVPLQTTYLATRRQFNDQLRTYCATNGKALFDIASIEAYDPSDNPVGGPQPTLYSGYTTDGGHLNTAGSVRVARAWWWLMARLAGWNQT